MILAPGQYDDRAIVRFGTMAAVLGAISGGLLGVGIGIFAPEYLSFETSTVLTLAAGTSAGIASAVFIRKCIVH